ncbi:MAG: hypothetical protein V3T88_06160 [Nitrosomonadaceae bacterium]
MPIHYPVERRVLRPQHYQNTSTRQNLHAKVKVMMSDGSSVITLRFTDDGIV